MAVYFKFKSAKDFDSIPIDGHFILVANLKERIYESKIGKGTSFDLIISNAQTNEEYLDEGALIPKNTSLLVCRVPVQRRLPIVTKQEENKIEEKVVENQQLNRTSIPMANASVPQYPEETKWDEFGDDLYAIPEATPVHSNNVLQEAPATDKADEDSKIKALLDSSALDWQTQVQDGFGTGRGFGRGMGGRTNGGGGRGFGRMGFERTTPPPGYVCHRCEMPGHFIQHCPTNGDPTYDKKRMKNPTGIPKDMLVANPDGAYAMPGGVVALMRPNEAAFDREVEGLSSTRSVSELPPELHCALCKDVMKDAVLTSKCCFNSYCDKCIRNYILSKSMCVCGATGILADDLLPNKTVRDTISRILESNNSSTENGGSVLQTADAASARCGQSNNNKASSSTTSATANAGKPLNKDAPVFEDAANGGQSAVSHLQQSLDKGEVVKAVSEVTLGSLHEKEPKSNGIVSHVEEEVQQRMPTGEPAKKKKKKKTPFPVNAEMQWRGPQNFPAENYMMPFPQPNYDPYWGNMHMQMPMPMPMGMDGYMGPPYGGPMPPYMGPPYGPGQGYFMPPVPPPQMDMPGMHMGFNHPAPQMMFREEFEGRKDEVRRGPGNDPRRREENEGRKDEVRRGPGNDPRGQREYNADRERGRELSQNVDVSSTKSKSRVLSTERNRMEGAHGDHQSRPPAREDRLTRHGEHTRPLPSREDGHTRHRERSRPPREAEPIKHGKTREATKEDSVEGAKSKKSSSSSSSHQRRRSVERQEDRKSVSRRGDTGDSNEKRKTMVMEQDSSDDDEDRHFKRRRTRHDPEPMERQEDVRPIRSSRESSRGSQEWDYNRRGRDYR
ncbi:RING-type E3 ubiquitin transferase [Ranunculus cassubicifolius]